MPEARGLARHVGLRTATALVVANIIGAGIFTTTGFQAADLGHPGIIFGLWILGGLLALAGALCYGELGAALPRAGAEYAYLRESYGPTLGFMSAFVSLVAGFAAPVAAALESFVLYAAALVPGLDPEATLVGIRHADLGAVFLAWILIAVHARGGTRSTSFNDVLTLLKVCGIAGIVLLGFAIGTGKPGGLTTVSPTYASLSTADGLAACATSLVFVMFCYSGWNAAAYMAAEMRHPERDLPRSLVVGTAIVIVLYLGLNAVFFHGAGVEGLAGHVDVGVVAARGLFGPLGVSLVTVVLCVSILASASAMTLAGPRVTWAFGRDVPRLAALARTSPGSGAPTTALVVQGIVTTILIFSGRVDQIQQYSGFTLSLFASLAVSCVIVLRIRRPDLPRPFRTPGYPFTPIAFLVLAGWMMAWAFRGRPLESIAACATAALGAVLCRFAVPRSRPTKGES